MNLDDFLNNIVNKNINFDNQQLKELNAKRNGPDWILIKTAQFKTEARVPLNG